MGKRKSPLPLSALVQGFILSVKTEGKAPSTVDFLEGNLRRFLWYARQQGWPDDAQAVDAWSRLPVHHELMALASSEAAARILREAVEINGTAPRIVVTDNASTFVNLKGRKLTPFQAACGRLGIDHRRIPFGHPQSIGRIERFHRTLREEEIGLHLYSNPEEARERIRAAIERYSTQRYHQGIGDIKPIDRHEGREEQIQARREELFSSVKRNGRKPKVLAPV